METGVNGDFPTDWYTAQPGAVLQHAEEEDKSSRELGVAKNKPMTAGSRTVCLQPSLLIGYTSLTLRLQNTHTQKSVLLQWFESLFVNK